MAEPSGQSLVKAHGIVKRFGGEVALAAVDFTLEAGEIHALLGENGAGKSTLIKVLAGVVQRDDGSLRVRGSELPRHFAPADVASAGLAFVHQDLGVADDLSVAENIALAVGYSRRAGLIRFRATERRVAGLLAELGLSVSPRTLVGRLAQDEKVMVAVARAFSLDANAIVLDEVSSSLPAPAVERLQSALRAASRSGVGFVYVTHRLDEIYSFADRATILRDGRRVAILAADAFDHDTLVGHIVGKRGTEQAVTVAARTAPPASGDSATARLRVTDLHSPGLDQPVSFEAAPGETIAFSGLVGCGAREIASLLGGASRPDGGRAELDGDELPLGDPNALRRAGCTYVPGDRQSAGGVFSLSVRENLFLRRSSRRTPRWMPVQRSGPERRAARELVDRFEVRPRASSERPLWTLSGGNQQKVIAGRALSTRPRMIVVDDPTAGVDIGSRAQLHRILRDAAAEGTVVVLASTDYDEVASQADRAFVLRNGRIETELSGSGLSAERLAEASYGSRKGTSNDETVGRT
jgi:ribose transport system ATP-binding protein